MTSVTRRSLGILSLGLAAAATNLLRADPARAEDIAVHIDNFIFEPAQLTVKVGTTVNYVPGKSPLAVIDTPLSA